MKVFIFDTETTGLVKNSLVPLDKQPRIIEFFGHTVDDETGDVLNEIEFFCDPGIPIEPIITRITGIKQEQLTGQKPFSSHRLDIQKAIDEADAVLAHNASFDLHLVECEFQRCNGSVIRWPRKICTVEQTEWIRSHRLSLTALHEELFGEGFPAAHRARTDVEALTRCYLELKRRGDI